MLEIDPTRPLIAGEDVEIGVVWAGSGLLSTRDLVSARVIRTEPLLGTRQRVAVRFARVQAQAASIVEHTTPAAA